MNIKLLARTSRLVQAKCVKWIFGSESSIIACEIICIHWVLCLFRIWLKGGLAETFV